MDKISEKYEIISELGHGAHSKVYLARHRMLDVLRAIKYVNKSEADSKRYLQEANLIKNLKHPGIPMIYDIEEDQNSIYIIEEYITGSSMSTFMRENTELTLRMICEFGIQICEILEYLHSGDNDSPGKSGILHLDLKPDNIMIDKDRKIKIIDYDNALYVSEGLKHCIGSKGFAAPEQYHRLNPGKTADIYGLGILLLYMSNGGHMHSNVEIIRHENLRNIIKKCIRHNPLQRYDDVIRVKQGLNKILKKLSVEHAESSLEINVFGTKHGIGSTHICLCLTSYLNRTGLKTVCIDGTDSCTILSVTENANITSIGTYQLYGAYLLPNYNECIRLQLDPEYQIIVRDCGSVCEANFENVNCERDSGSGEKAMVLVGSAKCYEQNELKKIVEKAEGHKKSACILNHMSGRQFYSFVRDIDSGPHFYRMPCKYEWHSKDEVSDEMFREMMDDLFPGFIGCRTQKAGSSGRCISEIIKKKKK